MEQHTDQLQLLMDYTIFHIGLYSTLSALLLGIVKMTGVSGRLNFVALVGAIFFFALAGAAGGIIGSSIPNFKSFDEFKATSLGLGSYPYFVTRNGPR